MCCVVCVHTIYDEIMMFSSPIFVASVAVGVVVENCMRTDNIIL